MNLTKPQKLIYDMEKYAGGTISIICGSMLSTGRKDTSELKQAVNKIYQLNDALRIHIRENNEEVYQEVVEYVEQDIDVLYFDNKTELNEYAEHYAKIPLDLYRDLCEIKIVILSEQYGLLVKLHHMIGDAWTLSLMGTQFHAILNDEAIEAYSYIDYVESENKYIDSKRYEKDRNFFLQQFQKCDEVTYLNEKQSNTLESCRKTFIIEKNQAKQIVDYVQKKGISVFMLLTAILSTYMNRVKMNEEKFYIGTAVLNRNGIKEKNTMGMFVNTVPMLIELDNTKSFTENLTNIEQTLFSILRHQKYNYGEVLSAIRQGYGFTEKLYDVMISYQNATIAGGDSETTWYHSGMQSESLQIHIDDRDNEGIFRIHYDYLTEKFTEHEIVRLHQHMCNLLFDAIRNDDKKLYELEIVSEEEQKKLLYGFNDTAIDYPRDKCVHQLFEEQEEKTPDKVALVACDRILTYAELNAEANKIAHGLIKKGVQVGDIVAFALPRDSYLIATMLGILKAGAAYLPIDLNYPQDRIDYMLCDSKAKYMITKQNIVELLESEKNNNLCVDMESDALCYCIYTSGSTGQPKGVLVKHYNVLNFIDMNAANYFQKVLIDNCDYILVLNSIVFDITLQEVHLPLLNGKTIMLLTENEMVDIDSAIYKYKGKNCGLIVTPTKLAMYMKSRDFCKSMDSFSVIMSGAETFPTHLFSEIRKYTNAIVFDGYGPTETTCGTLYAEVCSEKNITIGKPIANTQIYIVNKDMQITPIGVTGELCIAGDCVGAGYLNRPELTVEKFIDNPFGEGKLYKTGDLAYWREDGNIIYVGRNDFQVKIRGLRIELGEIENTICEIDGISQSVVVVRKNEEGRQLICAFYTGTEMDAKEIRKHLGQKLPKYMLPHICTHLSELPLTASGKINRKALPEIDLENITNETEYVGPENQRQKELCRILEKVLATEPVGITDDFFDLGGDSLKAIEYVSKAHSEGIYFNLQNVFDYPTVKTLCSCIENGDKQEISFADVDFSHLNKILEKNKLEYVTDSRKSEVGNILLAGATGYLGIHLLANFLDNDTGTAYCIVRGSDKENSVKRLADLLQFYFGDKYTDMQRIEVICGDLQKEKFGLDDYEYHNLVSNVNMVINSAASVKHYGSYQYFHEANVVTTKHLIEFCKGADTKLIQISTLSVSGNSFADHFDGWLTETEKHFYESSLYIGQPLDNVYARSKFEAEKVVLDAMTEGLQANIMRMGNLTNRYSDGMFQKNHESNAFLQRIKSVLELGVAPDYLLDLYTEFTPIDEAANAVMTIARHFSTKQNVFHINSTKVVYMDKLHDLFNQLDFNLEIVSGAEFTERLRQTIKQSGMEHIFETFINDMDENDKLNYDSNIHIENDFTVEYLRKLGFEWSDIGLEYMRKYLDYFKGIGYLNDMPK